MLTFALAGASTSPCWARRGPASRRSCDEPTGRLDPAAGAGVVRALRAIEGVTVIVATHDLGVARAFPRMIALRDGRVVHDGTGFDTADAEALYGVQA